MTGSTQTRTYWLVLLCTLSLVLVSCDSSVSEPVIENDPTGLHNPWVTAEPSEVGMDESTLQTAIETATEINRMRSLIVVKDGKLVVEEYFHGASKYNLFDVRSVTKSIVSILTGLAVVDGSLPSLDISIEDTFAPLFGEFPEELKKITPRHLLTMTAGWAHNERSGPSYGQWLAAPSPEMWTLTRPLIDTPGTTFTYNSSAVHLLGVILEKHVSGSLESYAETNFFDKLGIDQVNWEQLSSGYPNGGAGIDLRATDLAKIGQLFLNKGYSGSTKILSSSWIDASTTPRVAHQEVYGPLKRLSYGYLWWTDNTNPFPVYMAWGYGGQFIYVAPELELVVVTTTDHSGVSADPGGESALGLSAISLITDHVVKAVN
ncbi:serine hydrolase [bacterium]|nr:serine hydrolase [bacterium]